MLDLEDLYQEVVMDHSRRPRNFRKLKSANRTAEGFNPLCGDQITLYLTVEDGLITDIGFEGTGCAISKASASLMTDAVKGKTLGEARRLFEQFLALVTDDSAVVDDALVGKLAVFAGVRDYPTRVKCASLAWHTLRAAVEARHDLVSTE
jgi:nitrogen fixation NifU-like protein